MKRSFVLLSTLLVALVGAGREAPTLGSIPWRSVGPAISGGRASSVAGSNVDPMLVLLGSAGGGLWRSDDGGLHFRPIFDREPVSAIGAVAIDPANAATIWVGTGEANPRNDVILGDGLYRSTNAGASWVRSLALPQSSISTILVDPTNPAHVIVGVLGNPFAASNDRGIYVTENNGATWRHTFFLDGRTGISDMAMNPKNPREILAGAWTMRRTGWSLQSGGPLDGLYRSVDGGATWQRVQAPGLPRGPLGRIAVAFAPSNPARIYALLQSRSGLLWRSSDGGAHWKNVSNDSTIDERPFYFSHLTVDPQNENHLWSASVHLTESNDGGLHWHITGHGTHGDHHDMWISSDGVRILEADDGGLAMSNDRGKRWLWRKTLPISQLYRVGVGNGWNYRACVPLQDNGIYCAHVAMPDPSGFSSSAWRSVGGGDGTAAYPDPSDPNLVWTTSAGGNYDTTLQSVDLATGETRDLSPYVRDQNVVPPAELRYRFNWETPLAFDPFDPHRLYTAGNVLFATTDRGMHWQVESPDLTLHDLAHERMTGGLTLDGTGAETSDTILTIVPSSLRRGEIWIGTDDGLIQLTRDGGKHWSNVTPKGAVRFGRFASIALSPRKAGWAYAIEDAHMLGDARPYVFRTTDYGAHWTRIDRGLPLESARCITVDPRTSGLLYLGMERGIEASWDRGAHWRRINDAMPAVSVRAIVVQPDRNDLLVATHGRGLYVLDDAAALQGFARAARRGVAFFPPRKAYLLNDVSWWNTRADGASAPYGAIFSYYQSTASAKAPTIEIDDAQGRAIRHLDDLANGAGIHRVIWDLSEDPPVPWKRAPRWNRGYSGGASVVPGIYTVKLTIHGRTLSRHLIVAADPRMHAPLAAYRAAQQATRSAFAMLSQIDVALNALDAREAAIQAMAPSARRTALLARIVALRASLTSSPHADQDDDFLRDRLRERVQTEIGSLQTSFVSPTAEQLRENALLARLTARRVGRVKAWLAGAGSPAARGRERSSER